MPLSSSYTLGLVFLLIVSITWTICSMVVQYLYQDMEFNSPFLIVYIGTSLFSVFLPLRLGYERLGPYWKCCRGNDNEGIVIIPWRNDLQLVPTMVSHPDEDGSLTLMHLPSSSNNNDGYNDIINTRDDYSFDPSNAVDMQSNRFDNESSSSSFMHDVTSNNHHNNNNYEPDNQQPYLYSHQNHISMASKIAPLWFASNYFYAISLEYTTIASSTVLASMGSLFAFGFATCSSIGDERITKCKLVGVVLCFMGGVATAYTDVSKSEEYGNDDMDESNAHYRILRHWYSPHIIDNQRSFWGDMAGLLSAIGYGAYTNLLRHLCPQDEKRMSMQLFFGYVGLLNMVALLPVALWVLFKQENDDNSVEESIHTSQDDDNTTTTTHTTITWSIFLFLILKGLLDNVLSDYLWARAVILTSATVASVSVGLTIPMAFVADAIMVNGDATHSTSQIVGALLVLCGFVFVNVDGMGEKSGVGDGGIGNNSREDDGGEIEFENGGFDYDDGRVRDVDIVL
ncbi:hypothetical protein ACHAWO_001508 [Cyclotella atomus]|uniref:EamA domain-containing protein n=1 Tax=Cyclotella atomus TaxID=382360 RepID=A0ABD3NRU1_9STRA